MHALRTRRPPVPAQLLAMASLLLALALLVLAINPASSTAAGKTHAQTRHGKSFHHTRKTKRPGHSSSSRHRKHHSHHRRTRHPQRTSLKSTSHRTSQTGSPKSTGTGSPSAKLATHTELGDLAGQIGAPDPGEGTPTPGATSVSASDPFAGQTLYVDPNSTAATTQRTWSTQGRSAEAAQLGKLASRAVARWFGNWSYGHGGTAGDVSAWVGQATAAHALPLLVAYDIPWRDCSQYSAGGAGSVSAYRQFIDAMSQGIEGRRAVVIVEPDALAELQCLSSEQQAIYYELLNYAVTKLGSNPLVSVYLDAGNAHWQSTATIAARLRQAGVARARGFSLNVSNFDTTSSESSYGDSVAHILGSGAHYVIDTSRNGQGPATGGAWCNPPGRGLGTAPTATTSDPLADAYLWVKQPGNSDGTCNGGPAAGQFWPEYALGLAQRSVGS